MNRELLEKRFTPAEIKQRDGGYGEVVDYLEGATVIQRLNEAFNGEWSFEIVEHLIQEKEVLVSGKLTAGGITKTQYGNKEREKSIGDDLKAAATDCIKKCATLFGIGLHLYFSETTTAPAPPPAAEPARRPAAFPLPVPNRTHEPAEPGDDNGPGRLTSKQMSAIFGIAKGKGWSNKETRQYTQDRFGKVPDFLTKREASSCIDALKAGSR